MEKDKREVLVSLKDVADVVGLHFQTLYKWRRTRPTLFNAIIDWYLAMYLPEVRRNEIKIKEEDKIAELKNK